MVYSSKLLQDGRYGIFVHDELTFVTTCRTTCEKLMQALEQKVNQNKQSENLKVTA